MYTEVLDTLSISLLRSSSHVAVSMRMKESEDNGVVFLINFTARMSLAFAPLEAKEIPSVNGLYKMKLLRDSATFVGSDVSAFCTF